MIMKGQKISDRYQIIKAIGEGGMANVYLAYDTILDRNVAVKVLRGDLANDEKFVRRFQREALSASSLSHPNIVEVYDVGEDAGQYYIVMEYVEGKNLKDLIKKRGKLTLSEVIDIMLQITDGMSVAHDSYIIHRDIKPQNIMILENGMVKIMDFGIAMAMNSTQLTQTNSVMGSVHYIPPEQANGKGAILQSDIYSMGIVMYELLTGTLPYRGDNAVEIALKHLKEPLPSIREILPNIPTSVENIIIKATAKNPKNRYSDAREMHMDLLTCLDEERLHEPKITLPYPEFTDDKKKESKKISNDEPVKSKNIKIEKTVDDEGENLAKQITKNDLKKQNKLLIVLASIFTFLIVAITTIVILIPALTTNKEITIPDVSGYTVEDALKTLQDAGFKVASDQQKTSSDTIPYGNVVKTSPLANTKRTKGTEVTLWVSEGDSKITLEDYAGKNYLEIKGKLEALDIQVLVEKKSTTDEKAEENTILSQTPAAGEKVSKGDYVTLYIPNVDKYPDFTTGSYTYNDVVDYLKKYNVTVNKIEKEDNSRDAGIVIGQSREKGSRIVENTSITITVTKKGSSTTKPKDDGEQTDSEGRVCGTEGATC